MKFDLSFQLVDLPETGNASWYSAAASMMLASARQAFKHHDMRVIQMTDEASAVVDGIDIRFAPTPKCERAELMQYRGHCTAEWALQTDRPTIFCDVDLLWNNDSIKILMEPVRRLARVGASGDGNFLECLDPPPDITLFVRQANAFQPFNGGLIVTQPKQDLFWTTYRSMMKVLPNDCKGWWGDQIALGVLAGLPQPGQSGAHRYGSRLAFLPIELVAPSPKTVPIPVLLETSALHFKGAKRKPDLANYFAMLQRNWSAQQAAE